MKSFYYTILIACIIAFGSAFFLLLFTQPTLATEYYLETDVIHFEEDIFSEGEDPCSQDLTDYLQDCNDITVDTNFGINGSSIYVDPGDGFDLEFFEHVGTTTDFRVMQKFYITNDPTDVFRITWDVMSTTTTIAWRIELDQNKEPSTWCEDEENNTRPMLFQPGDDSDNCTEVYEDNISLGEWHTIIFRYHNDNLLIQLDYGDWQIATKYKEPYRYTFIESIDIDTNYTIPNAPEIWFDEFYFWNSIENFFDEDEFNEVEVIELPEIDDLIVSVENESFSLYSQKCSPDFPCYLRLEYEMMRQGNLINLYETDSEGSVIELRASTTLPYDLFSLYKFTMATQTPGTIEYFQAWDNDNLESSNVAKITWISTENLVNEEWDLESACDDISTSSDGFWDGMRYGIECGIRKVLYWGFQAKPYTYLRLDNAKDTILTEFPFNVFNLLKASFEVASSTATTTLEIPVTWIDTDTNLGTMTLNRDYVEEDQPLLLEKFFEMQSIFFYTSGFFIIIYIGLSILKIGKTNDN